MLTIDDRRAREALIASHSKFSREPQTWTRGTWECECGTIVSRCMMGEIAYQLGICPDLRNPLFKSLFLWFSRNLNLNLLTPMDFNDTAGYAAVIDFLAARISDLDRELCESSGTSGYGVRAAALTF